MSSSPPDADFAMNGTNTRSSSWTASDELSDKSAKPCSVPNRMLRPSENSAVTMTCAVSPSYVKGPLSTDTVTLIDSNGCNSAVPRNDFADIDTPWTICASKELTEIVRLLTLKDAEPSKRPPPPATTTAASPAEIPVTMLPLDTATRGSASSALTIEIPS